MIVLKKLIGNILVIFAQQTFVDCISSKTKGNFFSKPYFLPTKHASLLLFYKVNITHPMRTPDKSAQGLRMYGCSLICV